MGRRINLGASALCALILAACGTSGSPPFVVTKATADVTITHCGESANGLAIAEIEVTNHSSVEADYVTTIAFSSRGTLTKSGPGFERGVAAGKSVSDQVTGTVAVQSGSKMSCKVSSVSRTPSTVTTTAM